MSVEADHCPLLCSLSIEADHCPSLSVEAGHCPSLSVEIGHCLVTLATVRRSWPLTAAVSVPGRPVVSPGYYRLSVRGAGERGRREHEALGVTSVGVPPTKGTFISRRRDRDAVSFNGFPVAAASPLADNQCPSGSPSCLPPTCWRVRPFGTVPSSPTPPFPTLSTL